MTYQIYRLTKAGIEREVYVKSEKEIKNIKCLWCADKVS